MMQHGMTERVQHTKNSFYNGYHQKNAAYRGLIGRNNFTYFYILRYLHEALYLAGRHSLLLDIGCGVGTISLYAAQFVRLVVGIDVSSRAINIAEEARQSLSVRRVLFRRGEMANFNNVFDIITCFEVIEHVPDESAFLKRVNASLRDRGVLLLSTPLRDTVLANSRLYKNFDAEVGHLRRYTREQIVALLKQHGFSVLKTQKTESPLRNLLFVLKLNWIIRLIKGPLVPLFHWIDELLIPIFGASNILVIAQKKV